MVESLRVLVVQRCCLVRDNKLLLVKRSPDDKHHPNLWECPGGKLDRGQSVKEACFREVWEETGLTILSLHPLKFIEDRIIRDGRYSGYIYLSHFNLAKVDEGEVKLSGEHSEHAWVSYSLALKYRLTPQTRRALPEFEKLIPHFAS